MAKFIVVHTELGDGSPPKIRVAVCTDSIHTIQENPDGTSYIWIRESSTPLHALESFDTIERLMFPKLVDGL